MRGDLVDGVLNKSSHCNCNKVHISRRAVSMLELAAVKT